MTTSKADSRGVGFRFESSTHDGRPEVAAGYQRRTGEPVVEVHIPTSQYTTVLLLTVDQALSLADQLWEAVGEHESPK